MPSNIKNPPFQPDCRSRMDYRKQEADAANERHKAMTARAEEAEKALAEAKALLLRAEANAAEQIRAKDERIAALCRNHASLAGVVLRLHGQVDEHNAIQRQLQVREHEEPAPSEEDSSREELEACVTQQTPTTQQLQQPQSSSN